MTFSFIWTAFFMGLVGGPHCLAMCAAPCHAITQGVQSHKSIFVVDLVEKNQRRFLWPWRAVLFHLGRLLGYGVLGSIAAHAMDQIAWFSDRTSAFHSVWVLMHLAVFAWGLLMVFQGQQPQWLELAGRKLWSKVQPVLHMRGGTFFAGMAWALLPCGLLYSAVLVAALSGVAGYGAASMLAFGLGGAVWLVIAPYAWRRLSGWIGNFRAEWGLRAAGGMLVAVSLWALWMDLIYKPSLWCR